MTHTPCSKNSIQRFRYLTKETMIREKILPTTDAATNVAAAFVDLSICPAYVVAYKDAALKKYGLDGYMYRSKGVYVNLTSNKFEDPHVIYDSITHDVDEIISSMTFKTANRTTYNKVKIEFNKTHLYDDIRVTTAYTAFFGKCYSIRPKVHLLSQGIQAIDIVTHNDAYVYFGHPGQLMHPDTTTRVID